MARKTKTTTEFGAKFGASVRKKHTKVTTSLRQKRNCPECNSIKFKRVAIGIWTCNKCKFKVDMTLFKDSIIRIKTNKKSSELVKESIKQDIKETDSIQARNDKLVMEIKAKEISELRAKISSHIRAAKVSYDILTE